MRVAGLFGATMYRGASLCALALLLTAGLPPDSRAQADGKGLPDYPSESGLLVDTPGVSAGVAAGMFNPAAWSLAGASRLYLGWEEQAGVDPNDWALAASVHKLGFGARRLSLGTAGNTSSFTDYTIGLGRGDKTGAFGISYSWASGDLDRTPRHERISLGHISRRRRVSLGVVETVDLETRDNFLQVDLGIRPIGPRLTLFGDAVYGHGDSMEDVRTGYGVEFVPIPGLSVAAKARNTGEFSFRVGVDVARNLRASFSPRFDDDSDRTASTYSIELGLDRPPLGYGQFGVGESYPTISLKGGMPYRTYKYFDNRRTLLGTLRRMNDLADGPRVGGVVINMSGMSMSPEMCWELREQLAGLRARGKVVVVYFDRASVLGMMLASVADQIWMDPSGMVDMTGISMGSTYYKNLLEKAGLGVEEWRFLTYKSAWEAFARESMSDSDEEQRQALVDDFYETGVKAVASARGISRRRLDELVNEKGILLPEEALAAGLVDSIGTIQQASRSAKSARRRSTGDPSHAVLEGTMGDPVWGSLEWGEPPHIAVLYAIGPCAMDSGIKGRLLSRKIRQAREDPDVKAVVLRADSPGGEVLPSDLVARELKETAKKKPVIVSQGQVAASGGYWISMYGDSIVASPITITGSIGVIAGWIWNEEFSDKIGMTYDGVHRGEHADLGAGITLPLLNLVVPNRPLTDEEHERMMHLMRSLYRDFVAKVAQGRGIPEEKVDEIGQGRVWSGLRALENGLVDELGGLWHALRLAKQAAGIPDEDVIHIDEGPEIGAFSLGRLLGSEGFGFDPPEPSVEKDAILPEAELEYVRRIVRAKGEPLLMIKPIEIRDGAR